VSELELKFELEVEGSFCPLDEDMLPKIAELEDDKTSSELELEASASISSGKCKVQEMNI
jgi:hypothetical protein